MDIGKLRTYFDRATVVFLAWTFLVGVGAYLALPGKIVTRFDDSGRPSAYGGKESLLIEPAVAIALYFLLEWVSKRPIEQMNLPVKLTPQNRWTMQRLVGTFVSYARLCTVAIFAWIAWVAVAAASGHLVGSFLLVAWLIVLALVAGFIVFFREARKSAE